MTGEKRQTDDLTIIDFIGSTMEKWLQKSFEVYAYADLAALSAEAIEERLKADGKIPDKRKIEMWIEQAATLSATKEVNTAAKQDHIKASENSHAARRLVNSGNGWKESAQFVVYIESRQRNGRTELQTTVHHIEGNAYQTWSGIVDDQLCQWIREHIEESAVEPADFSELDDTAKPVRVVIEKLRLRQPTQLVHLAGQAASQPPQAVKSKETSVLEIEFSLSGEGVNRLIRQQADYRAKAYALNLDTGAHMQLGSYALGKLGASQATFLAQLPEIQLQPGAYKLWCSVAILAENAKPDLIEAPELLVL
jgi:hypothetical protein